MLRESRDRHSFVPRPSVSQPKTAGLRRRRRSRGDPRAPALARASGRANARSAEARDELVVATRRRSADESRAAFDDARTDASTQDEIRSSAPRLVSSPAVRRKTREKIALLANFFSRETCARTSQHGRCGTLHSEHRGVSSLPREFSINRGNAKLSTASTAYAVAYACESDYHRHSKRFGRRRKRCVGFQGYPEKTRRRGPIFVFPVLIYFAMK
jgi:hypothetical protein